jgi:hypothetical protein
MQPFSTSAGSLSNFIPHSHSLPKCREAFLAVLLGAFSLVVNRAQCGEQATSTGQENSNRAENITADVHFISLVLSLLTRPDCRHVLGTRLGAVSGSERAGLIFKRICGFLRRTLHHRNEHAEHLPVRLV